MQLDRPWCHDQVRVADTLLSTPLQYTPKTTAGLHSIFLAIAFTGLGLLNISLTTARPLLNVPFVGRGAHVSRLMTLYEQASSGQPRVPQDMFLSITLNA